MYSSSLSDFERVRYYLLLPDSFEGKPSKKSKGISKDPDALGSISIGWYV
jgi:hypothetical protein